jgi:hypothetical protein
MSRIARASRQFAALVPHLHVIDCPRLLRLARQTQRGEDADLPHNATTVIWTNFGADCSSTQSQASNALQFVAGTVSGRVMRKEDKGSGIVHSRRVPFSDTERPSDADVSRQPLQYVWTAIDYYGENARCAASARRHSQRCCIAAIKYNQGHITLLPSHLALDRRAQLLAAR